MINDFIQGEVLSWPLAELLLAYFIGNSIPKSS